MIAMDISIHLSFSHTTPRMHPAFYHDLSHPKEVIRNG
jgi:hypothetical protein